MEEERQKRDARDSSWNCSVCTFENKNNTSTCKMCSTPRGTNSRQPKGPVSQAVLEYRLATSIQSRPLSSAKRQYSKITEKRSRSADRRPSLSMTTLGGPQTITKAANSNSNRLLHNDRPAGRDKAKSQSDKVDKRRRVDTEAPDVVTLVCANVSVVIEAHHEKPATPPPPQPRILILVGAPGGQPVTSHLVTTY